jgi:DDE superfamily endonuclease
MDQRIPSLSRLLDPLASAFRKEVFPMFCQIVTAWIVCLGRRTISRVWETTGQTKKRHHSAAFRLFHQAVWNWDEVMRLLLVAILQTFIPGTRVWVVVDDTLCHKRGAKVAFGGIFLDAVLSTRKHKTFRFGNNWVLLGLVVSLPFHHKRLFCIPLLWRVYEKRGTLTKKEHRTKNDLAAEMVRVLAKWLPGREILVVADSAYIGKALLHDRPEGVNFIGPICWRAVLTATKRTRDGQEISSGKRLPAPAQLLDDNRYQWKVQTLRFDNGERRRLQFKSLRACWPTVAGTSPVTVVLIRDPKGEWRDEALVSTNPDLCDWDIVLGYCRRWSVEVAFSDAKGLLGFHDPCVWKKESVQRAAPMAWFTGTLLLLWYTRNGSKHKMAKRQRPWYIKTITTFTDVLASCRLALWESWWPTRAHIRPAERKMKKWLFEYMATAA